MLAALWFLADAAEEGKDVVLSMLVVGLVFLAVIALGELTHYAAAKRGGRSSAGRSSAHGLAGRLLAEARPVRTPPSRHSID